jgi:hypothetical protein
MEERRGDMSFWPILLTTLALVGVLIVVHETGHYLAGLTAGIPHGDMRICLFTFPQHVTIRDGESWVSPTQDIHRYIELTRRYFTSRGAGQTHLNLNKKSEQRFATLIVPGRLEPFLLDSSGERFVALE